MPLVTMDMNLSNALKKFEISPDIVPEDFSPSTLVTANYANGQDVALGNFIKPSESADIPQVNFVAPNQTAEYALLMVDPDAPSKEDPKWGPYRHWVVVNIPASGHVSKGSVLAPYIGPGPPPNTRDHRYIFLLYEQPETQIKFDALAEESNNWDFKDFVQQHNLKLVAVNFFISRNDVN